MKYQTELYKKLTEEKKSAYQRYAEIIVGTNKLSKVIYYELMMTFMSPMGGAIGLALRKIFYRRMFNKIGKNVIFGINVSIRCPNQIRIGSNVVIDDNVLLDGRGPEEVNLEIGDNVFIGRGCLISCHDGMIKIGDNTNIGPCGMLISGSKLIVGNNVIMAGNCYIAATTKRTDRLDIPIIAQGFIGSGVTVGDNVWLGAGVIINDGTYVGKNCVVGSGAVVTKDIPDEYIAYGIPAKPIRKR